MQLFQIRGLPAHRLRPRSGLGRRRRFMVVRVGHAGLAASSGVVSRGELVLPLHSKNVSLSPVRIPSAPTLHFCLYCWVAQPISILSILLEYWRLHLSCTCICSLLYLVKWTKGPCTNFKLCCNGASGHSYRGHAHMILVLQNVCRLGSACLHISNSCLP